MIHLCTLNAPELLKTDVLPALPAGSSFPVLFVPDSPRSPYPTLAIGEEALLVLARHRSMWQGMVERAVLEAAADSRTPVEFYAEGERLVTGDVERVALPKIAALSPRLQTQKWLAASRAAYGRPVWRFHKRTLQIAVPNARAIVPVEQFTVAELCDLLEES